MDRRDFLAFIPSISAIPFIGAQITPTESKIEIIKPQLMMPSNGIFNEIDFTKSIQIKQQDKNICAGYCTKFDIQDRKTGEREVRIQLIIIDQYT